jgi:ABC-type Mn2+/Zn2+ transport system permease subunit
MERAVLAGLLLAVPLGLLGTWVVLRGLAFFSHAVGVATFPGVVVGLAVPALGAFGGALLAAVAFAAVVSWLERDQRVRGGAITAIALSAAMALGALLLTSAFGSNAPVGSVLFGSLLAVSNDDLVRCVVVALVAVLGTALGLRRLSAATFDPAWAEAAGAHPRRSEAGLVALLSVVVVTALPAVGSLLVSGLVVVPAATARLLSGRLAGVLLGAVGLCALEIAAGLALARALDLPPGAAIATLAGAGFALAGAGRVLLAPRIPARAPA